MNSITERKMRNQNDYDGGNMGAYLMDRTREETRSFKQGETPAKPAAAKPVRRVIVSPVLLAPAVGEEHPAVAGARRFIEGLRARKAAA